MKSALGPKSPKESSIMNAYKASTSSVNIAKIKTSDLLKNSDKQSMANSEAQASSSSTNSTNNSAQTENLTLTNVVMTRVHKNSEIRIQCNDVDL